MTTLFASRRARRPQLVWEPVRYCVETDTMVIELRAWPGRADETSVAHDAGPDLVIHDYAGDGEAWLWEIEHASRRPEHIVAALRELQLRQPVTSAELE